jgi:NitT/TauT family transport system substrate-binding protein
MAETPAVSAGNSQPFKITVGFAANLWFAQPAIIKGEGWDKEAGLDITLQRFPGPPGILQAFVVGQIDIMYNNMASTLMPQTRDIPTRMIASTIKDDIFLVARPSLTQFSAAGNAAETIKKFVAVNGRKVKISTNPKGSLSDLVLRYWLSHAFTDSTQYVDVINTGSQDEFQQSILSGDVDAASIFEPLYSIAHELDPKLVIIAEPKELMPDQPGGGVSIHESLAAARPDIVRKYLALHIRATQFLKDNPARAAQDISEYFGKGLVSVETYEKAIRLDHERFVSDPAIMIPSTKIMHDYMRKNGYLVKDVDIDKLFDLKTYNEVISSVKK